MWAAWRSFGTYVILSLDTCTIDPKGEIHNQNNILRTTSLNSGHSIMMQCLQVYGTPQQPLEQTKPLHKQGNFDIFF